jgi:hypothetical protein
MDKAAMAVVLAFRWRGRVAFVKGIEPSFLKLLLSPLMTFRRHS